MSICSLSKLLYVISLYQQDNESFSWQNKYYDYSVISWKRFLAIIKKSFLYFINVHVVFNIISRIVENQYQNQIIFQENIDNIYVCYNMVTMVTNLLNTPSGCVHESFVDTFNRPYRTVSARFRDRQRVLSEFIHFKTADGSISQLIKAERNRKRTNFEVTLASTNFYILMHRFSLHWFSTIFKYSSRTVVYTWTINFSTYVLNASNIK